MERLQRLKARISSLQELRDLFRAMRALAASHVQEAQSALEGIRRYVDVIEDAIAEGAALIPGRDGRAPAAAPGNADVLIVACSEHGFAGAFNEQLFDRATAELKAGRQLGIIGRRGSLLAEERKLPVAWSLPMATRVGSVPGVTRRVADRLAGVAMARIVFGSYRKGGHFDVAVKTILPLAPALLAGAVRGSRPLHHIDATVLLQRLSGEYLFAEITRCVMESLASENAARLQVMEAADHNIGDKLEQLSRRERHARQEFITSELGDIITGAEAMLGRPE